ncbi:hypothetical protein GGE07_005982 [Sinorhizobium terangae]|uniref:Uncharacterized protein n=1 Tax=Sinorhizobium terangae TaxID=110322 RepID=A0A6N7LK96_SINTE|nr:hypothetical protein [Sinorhizobium terangae]MBB4189300.1 hypothetical protein [Sinorhizobium terangae]MQX18187.1 hypothetical protein [Sinorhizobium terangae]
MKEVRVEVVEDEERYFGHALITFHNVSIGDGPVQLVVSRKSTDTPYLGADGWQAGPAAMEAEVVSRSPDQTVVRAGPNICDRIPYSLYVRLQLDGAEVYGQAFWPEIMQNPKGYSGTLEGFKVPPELPPKPADPPEPLPLPAPPPLFEPPPVPILEPVKEEDAPVKPPKRGFSWVFLLLLLLVGGGGLGYSYWPKSTPTPPPQPQPTTTEQEPATPPPESLSAKFARLKQSDNDGDELLALSEEAFQANDSGIGQQAIDLAVQRGNAAAKIRQAQWYDPRTFNASRAQAIDANRAARAYFELAIGGNGEARNLLTSICQDSRNGGENYRDFFDSTYCQGSLDP